MSFLLDRCDINLDISFCYIGNVMGWFSSVIWFIVLFPQIFKNFKEKSVEGISFLFAVMNFFASFTNLFFTMSYQATTFGYVSAIYMPIIELIFLFQFFIYKKISKILISTFCFLLTSFSLVNFFFSKYYINYLEWCSVILWSIETLPQIFLNFTRKSTKGLSNYSQTISFVGKTSDILSNYLLIIPIQYRYLGFFSTCSNYIIMLQIIFYSVNNTKKINNLKLTYIVFIVILLFFIAVGFSLRIENFFISIPVIFIFYTIIYGLYYNSSQKSTPTLDDEYDKLKYEI